jgi:acetyltransferase-like isoleucine patch superfamily enzyme
VTLGENALLAAYVYVVGGGHEIPEPGESPSDVARPSRGVTIGRNVWLGAGVKVLDGVRVGSDVVIGAGAVVTGDVPDRAVAAGVPAKILRLRASRTEAPPS